MPFAIRKSVRVWLENSPPLSVQTVFTKQPVCGSHQLMVSMSIWNDWSLVTNTLASLYPVPTSRKVRRYLPWLNVSTSNGPTTSAIATSNFPRVRPDVSNNGRMMLLLWAQILHLTLPLGRDVGRLLRQRLFWMIWRIFLIQTWPKTQCQWRRTCSSWERLKDVNVGELLSTCSGVVKVSFFIFVRVSVEIGKNEGSDVHGIVLRIGCKETMGIEQGNGLGKIHLFWWGT